MNMNMNKFYSILLIGIFVINGLSTMSAAKKFDELNEIICNLDEIQKEPQSLNKEIKITIYGTLYMIKNKPFGMSSGLYGTFENIGSESVDVYFGFHIKTISTQPTDFTYKFEQNLTIPSGSIGQMPISISLGIGVFEITMFLEGTNYDEGFYVEKKASGICLGSYQFIIKN